VVRLLGEYVKNRRHKPLVLVENVMGALAPHPDGQPPAALKIASDLRTLGYSSVAGAPVDFAAAGMLQARERIVIAASNSLDAKTLLFGSVVGERQRASGSTPRGVAQSFVQFFDLGERR